MKKIFLILAFLLAAPAWALSENVYVRSEFEMGATTTSTQALGANPLRNYLLIQNKGTDTIYVKFNAAGSAGEGVMVTAGGNYEPLKPLTSSFYVRAASGTQTLTVIEGY